MAEAPSEAAMQEAAVAPRMFYLPLCSRKAQRLITSTHSAMVRTMLLELRLETDLL